ncbi:hypothetical protein [Aeromonas caviae]
MDYSEFKDHFSILSDTRQARKSTYNFFEVMFQVVTAMPCHGPRMQGNRMKVPIFKGLSSN